MILVDTSVWVDHLRSRNEMLAGLLDTGRVLTHPFVIGEVALGTLRQRKAVLGALTNLPAAAVATDAEILDLIDRCALHGRGVGYVDAHLLASARLTVGACPWTRDKRLRAIAAEMKLTDDSP